MSYHIARKNCKGWNFEKTRFPAPHCLLAIIFYLKFYNSSVYPCTVYLVYSVALAIHCKFTCIHLTYLLLYVSMGQLISSDFLHGQAQFLQQLECAMWGSSKTEVCKSIPEHNRFPHFRIHCTVSSELLWIRACSKHGCVANFIGYWPTKFGLLIPKHAEVIRPETTSGAWEKFPERDVAQ